MEINHHRKLQHELLKLGQRLRSLRSDRSWTLGYLSQQANVSEAYLSRLESGERQPSLAVLFNLARVYGLSLPDLFQTPVEDQPTVEPTPKTSAGVVIRVGDQLLQKGNGLFYASLAGGMTQADLHPLRIVVSANRQGEQSYQHNGEEWLYVLAGQITLTLGDEEFLLNPGDAAHFNAYIPHRLSTTSAQDAEIILVACAPANSLLQSYRYNSSDL